MQEVNIKVKVLPKIKRRPSNSENNTKNHKDHNNHKLNERNTAYLNHSNTNKGTYTLNIAGKPLQYKVTMNIKRKALPTYEVHKTTTQFYHNLPLFTRFFAVFELFWTN